MHNGISTLARTLRTGGDLGPNTVRLEELKSDRASRREASDLAHALLRKERVEGEDLDPLPNQIDWNGWKGSVNLNGDVICVNVHKGADYRYVETRIDEPASVYIRASEANEESFEATALFQQENLKLVRQGRWSEIDEPGPPEPPHPVHPPPVAAPRLMVRQGAVLGSTFGIVAGGLLWGLAGSGGATLSLAPALAAGCLLGAPVGLALAAKGYV